MDFSDQISLGARLADEQPEVGRAGAGAVPRRAARRVPGHLGGPGPDALAACSPAPTPSRGRGHAVTAVGDPNQAIYGWRGASVSNILNFADTFPPLDGGEVPVLPLTVNRRSDRRILEVANALAAPLYDELADGARRSRPSPTPPTARVGAHVFETQDDELAWLAEAVARAARDARAAVVRHRRAHPRQQHAPRRSSTPSPRAGIPVEIVGLSGPAAAARGGRDRRHARAAPRRHRQRRGAHPAHRSALGDRAARPGAAQGARRPSWPGVAAAPRAPRSPTSCTEIADGIDPAELPALSDALEDPGERGVLRRRRCERFALLADELRSLRAYAGEPILDVVRRIVDITGIDVELASAVSPAAAARGATTSTCSSRPSPSSRRSTAT